MSLVHGVDLNDLRFIHMFFFFVFALRCRANSVDITLVRALVSLHLHYVTPVLQFAAM